MSMPQFFRTREWVIARRLILVALVLILAYRTWGRSLLSPLQSPNGARDVAITSSEFRPEVPGAKPAWIIGLRNNSTRFTYDRFDIEAKYLNQEGGVLQTDKMTLRQKLVPGQEEIIGSTDFKERPGAVNGTLKILDASVVR